MSDDAELDPLRVAFLVTHTFEALGVRYFIGGSLASIFHGLIRTTNDADLVAELDSSHVTALVAALEGAFYIDAESIREGSPARRALISSIWRRCSRSTCTCPADVHVSLPSQQRRQSKGSDGQVAFPAGSLLLRIDAQLRGTSDAQLENQRPSGCATQPRALRVSSMGTGSFTAP